MSAEPTPTQALVQRLTASIQGETYLEVAERFDTFVSQQQQREVRGGEEVIPVAALEEFYLTLYGQGTLLRQIASGS